MKKVAIAGIIFGVILNTVKTIYRINNRPEHIFKEELNK